VNGEMVQRFEAK